MQAEKAVEQALDSLVMTGIQPIVWILIPSSTHKLKLRSSPRSLRRKFSRLSSDDISELAVGKPPMCKGVLQAVSVILRFSSMLDNTAACKMESVLASFTCQTCLDAQRAMKETTTTHNRVLRRLLFQ
ncbi:hypothetical protein BD413DRAFT_505718, partial [Trametes elegans]